jgi:hypothetical protein
VGDGDTEDDLFAGLRAAPAPIGRTAGAAQ